jgi:acetoin utilization deacetylase AcuC-like enzyme
LKVFACDHYVIPLPRRHRFPIRKYALLREAVAASGLVPLEDLDAPELATDEQILRVHTPEYLENVKTGRLTEADLRRIGFPWSPELVTRSRCSVGGTISACRAALQDGVSVNLAGGTHHAFQDHGQGYCIFNDSVIAVRTMQAEGRIHRAAILDGDVHQGNGTAALAADDPTIFTFSAHSESNFPLRKEGSDLDIGLPDGTGDADYLAAWETGVRHALSSLPVELAVYLAGADPYKGDLLGRLALTKRGLAERDRMVFELCAGAGIPVATLMAGGYARHVQDTVDIHLQTVRLAAESAERYLNRHPSNGAG